jgi:hypothetical protein
VVVGMNARRRSFRAVVVARRGVAVVGMNSFVVRFEQGSGGGQNIPSVSHFERGRRTCVAAVGRVVATLDVPSLTFRGRDTLLAAALMFGVTRRVLPLFATSKMVFDVMRRGETLLVTSLCLQTFRISQYSKIIYFKKTCQLLGMCKGTLLARLPTQTGIPNRTANSLPRSS